MMDSMRGLLSGSHDREDGGIDAPAAIGVDERRMQVRAYNHWASLLGNRAYPSVEDLDLAGAGHFGPYSVLLDFTAGIQDPATPYPGARIRDDPRIAAEVHSNRQIP